MPEPLQPVEPSEPNRPLLVQQTLAQVQQDPRKSLISAFVVGLVLSIFPVGRIISFFLGLALMLVRPVLLVLGGIKVWEEVGRRRQ
jgi:hypothetical protein